MHYSILLSKQTCKTEFSLFPIYRWGNWDLEQFRLAPSHSTCQIHIILHIFWFLTLSFSSYIPVGPICHFQTINIFESTCSLSR